MEREFRCEVCGRVETFTSSLNVALWTMENAGWYAESLVGSRQEVPRVWCPEHAKGWHSEGLVARTDRWLVGCHTCDWTTDEEADINNDPSVIPTTEEEAKEAKRRHICDDWREDYEDCYIMSPEKLTAERRRSAEYFEQRRKQDQQKHREKEAALKYSELKSRTERTDARYRVIVELWPVWVCLVEVLLALAFWLGYTTT